MRTESREARRIADRYRIVARRGGGAMADVYEAADERLNRKVALKIFRAEATDLPRFEREARILNEINSAHVVRILDGGEDDGRPFVVLELFDHDLTKTFADGPMPLDRVATLGASLAQGLAAAHARGVVHRDVKPSNVLITNDGRCVLADFGIARLVDTARVTATGMSLGTPAYIAPEQAAGETAGPEADVYALGLVLLEAITGEKAFPGSYIESMNARLTQAPEIPTTLPFAWQSLLASMTAREPALRPDAASAGATLQRLADGAEDEDRTEMLAAAPLTEVMVAPTTAQPRVRVAPVASRQPPWLLPALLVLAVLLIGAFVLALQDGSREPTVTDDESPTTVATQPRTTRAPAVVPTVKQTPVTEPPDDEPANAAVCESLADQKQEIQAEKQQVAEEYADDPQTRAQMTAQLEAQEAAIEAQEQAADC